MSLRVRGEGNQKIDAFAYPGLDAGVPGNPVGSTLHVPDPLAIIQEKADHLSAVQNHQEVASKNRLTPPEILQSPALSNTLHTHPASPPVDGQGDILCIGSNLNLSRQVQMTDPVGLSL